MPFSPAVVFQVLFFLSGIAGLVHESLWARYLGLLLGHAAYGQVLTLVVYMGGIGLGSHLAARMLARMRDPLKAYVKVELGIAVFGFAFHALFLFLRDGLLDSGILAGRSMAFSTVAAVLTGSIATVPPAILLGFTFPLAAGGLMRLARDGGKDSIARLYFGNSLGAACGALLASYALVPNLGTQGSLWFAGLMNLLAALGAWLVVRSLARGERATPPENPRLHASTRTQTHPIDRLTLLVLFLALATGLSSFLYEIGWIRFLALLLGSSTHAFDIMIGAFVFGLALGARHIHRHPPRDTLRALFLAQVAMAAAAIVPILLYAPLFRASNGLNRILMRTVEAWPFHAFAQFLFSTVVMVPAAYFAGMTLPLATRFLCERHGDESFTGRVYAWNTLGAILGAAAGSLVLMPLVGLTRLVALGAAIDFAIALALLPFLVRRFWSTAVPLAATFLLVGAGWLLKPDNHLLVAGAYRGPRVIQPTTTIHRIDGRTATVSAQHIGSIVSVRTNGKPDASLDRAQPARARMSDELTQNLAAWIARVYVHRPWEGALIGLGSGMTAHRMLGDPRLSHLDAIEIEKAMWQQSVWFRPFNRRIHEDKRIAMHFLDARIFFATREKPYDVIVSEPSNPWVAGVSSLFTREFYREIRTHLARDGVFVQWLHTYEFEDALLLSIMAALSSEFPHLRLHYVPGTQDMVIVASPSPLRASGENLANAEDSLELRRFRMVREDVTTSSLLWTEKTIRRLVEGREQNSEFMPVVDGRAEKAFYAKRNSRIVPRTYGDVLFPQELVEGPDFVARKQAIQDLRERVVADSNTARPLAEWMECRSPLSEDDIRMVLSGWLPASTPAWTWSLGGVYGRVSDRLFDEVERSGIATPEANLFRFQYMVAHGDSAGFHEARLRALETLPRNVTPHQLRDLAIASKAVGDKRSAWRIVHEFLPRRDSLLTRAEQSFLDGM
jgi:predicted membrane-bound spermidine synthase